MASDEVTVPFIHKEPGDAVIIGNNNEVPEGRNNPSAAYAAFPWTHFLHESGRDVKDKSPEARAYRAKMMLRAVYGEFIGTTIFMTAVFGSIINLKNIEADPGVELLCVALCAGFSVIAVVMCFSKISGSNLNPVISFALWLTGRLSNRKLVLYITAQLLASIAAMCIIFATFSNPTIDMYKLLAVKPADGEDLGRIFFTQVLGAFMLTYVAFTMGYEEAALEKEAEAKVKQVHASDGLYLFSSSPQSKTGFAPFAVGFIVFVAAVYGGSSGCLLNPSRMFGPALFSGVWDYFYLYWLGMFTGAGLAALLVVHVQLVHPPPAPLLRE